MKIINTLRKKDGLSEVGGDIFEFIMDRFEKEAHFQVKTTLHPFSVDNLFYHSDTDCSSSFYKVQVFSHQKQGAKMLFI